MKRTGLRTIVTAALLGLAVTGMSARQAHAGYNVSAPTVTGAGPFTWSYSIAITNLESISSTPAPNSNPAIPAVPNFFKIIDFLGYVPGSIFAPAGWAVSIENTSVFPPPSIILNHSDLPGVPNLVFTYTGAVPLTSATVVGLTFGAQSTFGSFATQVKDFIGQTTSNGSGLAVDTRTDVIVPAPEPTSMISGGIGVILLGLGYAVRSRRKLAV